MKKYIVLIGFCISLINNASAQKKFLDADKIKTDAVQNLQSKYEIYKSVALDIWKFAEVGYKEIKSSALLQQTLRDNGFSVQVE